MRELNLKWALILFLITNILIMADAEPQAESFQDRLAAHTSRISAVGHPYGFGFIARRLFNMVRAGQTLGLDESDLEIIRNAGKPVNVRVVLEPFFDDLSRGLDENGNIYELAGLLESAREAEHDFENKFYQRVIDELSDGGREVFLQAHAAQLAEATITQIDFVALSQERPTDVQGILKGAVANFRKIGPESTSTANPGQIGIISRKGDQDEED